MPIQCQARKNARITESLKLFAEVKKTIANARQLRRKQNSLDDRPFGFAYPRSKLHRKWQTVILLRILLRQTINGRFEDAALQR